MSTARGKVRIHRAAVTAATLAFVALSSFSAPAFADPPLSPDEVRAERRIREDRPLWREALALPDDLLLMLAWPLKHALFWAEGERLDRRVGDLFVNPFHRRTEDQE